MPLYAKKICDMQVLAKYAITYAIVYSHVTGIPIKYSKIFHRHTQQKICKKKK